MIDISNNKYDIQIVKNEKDITNFSYKKVKILSL
jgi:hypothetical protein